MPEILYSLSGKVIKNRSTPGYDKRIRGEPIYYPERQLPMNHTLAPPEVVLDYYGRPLTESERAMKHYATIDGIGSSPARVGHGVSQGAGVQQLGFDWGSFFIGGILALIFGYFIFTSSGRKVGYAIGRKAERRLSR